MKEFGIGKWSVVSGWYVHIPVAIEAISNLRPVLTSFWSISKHPGREP